jgi:hypothetical protein
VVPLSRPVVSVHHEARHTPIRRFSRWLKDLVIVSRATGIRERRAGTSPEPLLLCFLYSHGYNCLCYLL